MVSFGLNFFGFPRGGVNLDFFILGGGVNLKKIILGGGVAHSCATQKKLRSFYRRKSPPQAKILGYMGGQYGFFYPMGGGQLGKIYPRGGGAVWFFYLRWGKRVRKKGPRGWV